MERNYQTSKDGSDVTCSGFTLSKNDVWGKFDERSNLIHPGLVVARIDEECPIWGDMIAVRGVTIVCDKSQLREVEHWIVFVQGGEASKTKHLPDNKIALRSYYWC